MQGFLGKLASGFWYSWGWIQWKIVTELSSTSEPRHPQSSFSAQIIHGSCSMNQLGQWSTTFFGTRDWFHGRQLFHGIGVRGWFLYDPNALPFLSTSLLLLLHQLHLRSSSIRSRRLRTPDLGIFLQNTKPWEMSLFGLVLGIKRMKGGRIKSIPLSALLLCWLCPH